MKQKLIAYLVLITLFMSTLFVLVWSNIPDRAVFITLNAGLVALLCALLVMSWLRFTAHLAGRLNNCFTGNKRHFSAWRMDGIYSLEHDIAQFSDNLAGAAEYIAQLGQPGSNLKTDAVRQDDRIGNALARAQAQMQSLRQEEEGRHWIARGVAIFSELFRDKKEMNEHSRQIMSTLVKYLGANQGAMYVAYYNLAGGNYLEMTACFAQGGESQAGKRIYEGNGVLGQNMLEPRFVSMTDVPEDYIKITSGLGASRPRHVIIAPLLYKEQYYGAIELALFEVLTPVQVEFLNTICGHIAGEISSVKTFEQTNRLLAESNTLAVELKQHEEEMRQNLEELAATQEEMTRKQAELTSYLQAINNTIAAVEFDVDGNFVTANEIFLKVMGFDCDELAGSNYKDLMIADAAVEMMWDNLKEGKFFSGEFRMKSSKGNDMWLAGTFNPITRGGQAPDKIMMYAQFTTQEKERINELGAMVTALKATLPVVEFNADFVCKAANEKFLKLLSLSRAELRSKTILHVIAPHYSEIFERIKPEILSKEFSTVLLPVANAGRIITYESSISVNRTPEGRIAKIILILVKKVEERVPVLAAI